MTAVIEARGLAKTYGATRALDGVSFSVAPGRIVGLIGPNGAGKTTALKAILGLTSFSGELAVLGLDPRTQRDALMREVCSWRRRVLRAGCGSARRWRWWRACIRASIARAPRNFSARPTFAPAAVWRALQGHGDAAALWSDPEREATAAADRGEQILTSST